MMKTLRQIAASSSGYKRLSTIMLALVIAGANRLGITIDPELALDITCIILAVGLGAHKIGSAPKPSKALPLITLVLLSSCTTLEVTATKTAWISIKVEAPHRVEVSADGEVRYTQDGPMPLELRGRPGDCIKAGEDGVFRVCE